MESAVWELLKIASDFEISYDANPMASRSKKIIRKKSNAQIYAETEQR